MSERSPEANETPEAFMRRQMQRMEPDYVAYCPKHWNGSTNDSENEHFIVVEGPDDTLVAVESQASGVGGEVNRIVFLKSLDGGKTWTEPKRIAGPPTNETPPYMASWGFPMVSKSGRIYVVWNQNQNVGGRIFFHTGTMAGAYSDDLGETWSEQQDIPMPRGPYDDPTGEIPPEWIVWQAPMRDLSGGFIAGYSHWFCKEAARYPDNAPSFAWFDSVVEFMRFTNVDDHPEPRDLNITWHAWGDEALRVPHRRDPLLTIAQEPSIVRLPDDRLFCVFRTDSGCIWYSESSDDGHTWINPRPLLRRDAGLPILQPVSCSPIYQLADGRYALFHHNHPGDQDPEKRVGTWGPRRPLYVALGEFRPDADQPLWFSESKRLYDYDGYTVPDPEAEGGEKETLGSVGIYGSFTAHKGENVLWDSPCKCWLIGKKITDEFLADLEVPE